MVGPAFIGIVVGVALFQSVQLLLVIAPVCVALQVGESNRRDPRCPSKRMQGDFRARGEEFRPPSGTPPYAVRHGRRR